MKTKRREAVPRKRTWTYNVWQYYEVTGDKDFISFYGAELMIEIARFWASKAQYNQSLGRYEILSVMGPDEFHDRYPGASSPGIDNNAYTNVMVAWIFFRTLDALKMVSEDRRKFLSEDLALREEEVEKWNEIGHRLHVPFHNMIISQFEGYGELKEFDWEGYQKKYGVSRGLIGFWKQRGIARITTNYQNRQTC